MNSLSCDPLSCFSSAALWGIVALALLVSAILTLAKTVFGVITANFDEARDTDPHLKAIRQRTEAAPFHEAISLGRLVCNATAAVLAYSGLLRMGLQLTPWPALDVLVWVALIWHGMFLLVIFIPNLAGNLRPYTLARVTLALHQLAALPFMPPARASRRIYEWTLDKLGYDARLSFLTEDQRDMLESDTTAPEEESALEADERQMILNIFDFVETPVREIMTPRVDMRVLELTASLEEVVQFLNTERHSRVPVYRDNVDSIAGILHNREFLHWYTERGDKPFVLEAILKPAMFVPYHKKIDDLLGDFRRSGNQLAIVIDEYGGTAGLVTLEDILEEIVGDIKDEDDHDEEAPIVRLKDGKFLVDPLISLSDLEFELDFHLEAPEDSHVETLSGLIHATLGSLPAQGTEINLGPCKARILKVEGTRMGKILLIPTKTEE